MDYFLGIDPGRKGAFALISGDRKLVWWSDMPVDQGVIKPDAIYGVYNQVYLHAKKPTVIIEKPQVRPTDAKKGIATTHWEAGQLLSLVAFEWPYQLVQPQIWARSLHKGLSQDLKAKAKSKLAFERLFPDLAASSDFIDGKKIWDGRIDALLIAEYGRRLFNGIEC